MRLAQVRNWFVGDTVASEPIRPTPRLTAQAPSRLPAPSALAPKDLLAWPATRIEVVEALWGEGFVFPGGEEEAVRLVRPLGLSAAASLLLIGAGSGGPPRAIASKLGVWVSGFEADQALMALAAVRCQRAGLGKRAQVELWRPEQPQFRPHFYHHGLAIEPLNGQPPEPVLAAIARAIKPTGQIVLVELVADAALDRSDPIVARWADLEHRPHDPPTEVSVTRCLGRLGFDVRIVEDLSNRQSHLALRGWRDAVQQANGNKPSPAQAASMVAEAELWLLRVRLMRAGKIRLVRWQAIGRGAPSN